MVAPHECRWVCQCKIHAHMEEHVSLIAALVIAVAREERSMGSKEVDICCRIGPAASCRQLNCCIGCEAATRMGCVHLTMPGEDLCQLRLWGSCALELIAAFTFAGGEKDQLPAGSSTMRRTPDIGWLEPPIERSKYVFADTAALT